MDIVFFDYEQSMLDDVIDACKQIAQYEDCVITMPDHTSVLQKCDINFLKMYRDFIDDRIKEMEAKDPWVPFVTTNEV